VSDYTPTTEEEKMIDLTWDEVNELVLKARETERERIVKMLKEGAVLCAGGCGCFVDGGEGDPTCANCY